MNEPTAEFPHLNDLLRRALDRKPIDDIVALFGNVVGGALYAYASSHVDVEVQYETVEMVYTDAFKLATGGGARSKQAHRAGLEAVFRRGTMHTRRPRPERGRWVTAARRKTAHLLVRIATMIAP